MVPLQLIYDVICRHILAVPLLAKFITSLAFSVEKSLNTILRVSNKICLTNNTKFSGLKGDKTKIKAQTYWNHIVSQVYSNFTTSVCV